MPTATRERIEAFLAGVGSNRLPPCAYDTAWVAALARSPGVPAFPAALDWLRAHQQPDGSWGSPWPYYHDRLLSTLRAVLTLHDWRDAAADATAVTRGLAYIQAHAGDWEHDPFETIGFELIMPNLLAAAEERGLPLSSAGFAPLLALGAAKRQRAPMHLAYDARTPLAFSLEALGPRFESSLATALQQVDGSVSTSPAATAFLLQHCPDNTAGWAYITQVVAAVGSQGAAPAVYPIETFERAWVLYQLQTAWPELYKGLTAVTHPLLDFLHTTCAPGGWAHSILMPIPESDSTGVCFAVLQQAGYDLDPQLLYQYEEQDHFRVYPLERNPSVSAQAHILDALHYCAAPARDTRVDKVLRFLHKEQQAAGYWFDKWHVSPYYATSQVVWAAYKCAPTMIRPALGWLLATQRADGGWGYYASTAEETAYALLSLHLWQTRGGGEPCVPTAVLARGVDYLRARWPLSEADTPPLWIGKSLYVPIQVVQGLVLAALFAIEQGG